MLLVSGKNFLIDRAKTAAEGVLAERLGKDTFYMTNGTEREKGQRLPLCDGAY